MGYLTQEQLDQQLDLPVELPLTDLPPNQWLVVSSFRLDSPQAFTLRWLQLHLIAMDPVDSQGNTVVVAPDAQGNCVFPPQGPVLVTPGLGLCYLALYRAFDPTKQPSFQAAQEAPLFIDFVPNLLPPLYAIRSLTPTTYSPAGVYSFVVVNNTENQLESLAVSGQVRVNLAFGA
jgi:hypothetical protein